MAAYAVSPYRTHPASITRDRSAEIPPLWRGELMKFANANCCLKVGPPGDRVLEVAAGIGVLGIVAARV